MFVAMKSLESKALLALKISLDASFLTKEQIEQVVSWFSEEGLKKIIEVLVVTEAKQFSDYCLNIESGLKHSWAGDDLYFQSSYSIMGDVKIGTKVDVEYSNNGSYGGKDEELIEPNFSTNQIQVLYVHQKNECNFNGRYEDDEKHLLVIYNPLEGYKIAPEIQYILDNFNIK